jgi:hypothetical protein
MKTENREHILSRSRMNKIVIWEKWSCMLMSSKKESWRNFEKSFFAFSVELHKWHRFRYLNFPKFHGSKAILLSDKSMCCNQWSEINASGNSLREFPDASSHSSWASDSMPSRLRSTPLDDRSSRRRARHLPFNIYTFVSHHLNKHERSFYIAQPS